ncbi:MAG: hypothetical protein GYB32_03265 [Algicola sp.]|nr:hypothetical protein [Algicola sp.]
MTLNYDGLEDFVQNSLVINMDVPEEVATLTSSVTITFLREFDIAEYVCASDYEVSILLDNWGSETTWEIVDDSGAVIATGGPYTDGTAEQVVSSVVALPTGCYSFTIFDAYGDGLFDGTTTGTYEVNCEAQSVVKYVTGSGNFGDSETTDFCVN